jgi:hypothetical protein
MDLFGRLASRLMENSTELVVRMVPSSFGKRAASLTACGGDVGTPPSSPSSLLQCTEEIMGAHVFPSLCRLHYP